MRVPATIVCAFFFVVTSAYAQVGASFPLPITPEVPVSPVTYGWAAGTQAGVHAAFNGEITLAAWTDIRTGEARAFATRIADDGTVLDRLGIPLDVNAVLDVLWNGQSFVLVTPGSTYALTFVDANGKITGRKSIDTLMNDAQYVGAIGNGPEVRLCFVESVQAGGAAVILDGTGNVLIGIAPLWQLTPGTRLSSTCVAGVTANGFAFLAQETDATTYQARSIVIAAIDRDGRVLTSRDSQIPSAVLPQNAAISGGADGFVVLNGPQPDGATIGYALDANGVYRSRITVTPARVGEASGYAPARVAWSGHDYVIALSSMGGGHTYITMARLAAGSNVAQAKQVADFAGGVATQVSFVQSLAKPFLFTTETLPAFTSGPDVMIQRFTPDLDATNPEMLTYSGTRQEQPQIATIGSGYAVAWSELGPDQYLHAFVRRFNAAGEAFDPQPIELGRTTPPGSGAEYATMYVRIASNGSRYMAVWEEKTATVARRLGDAPGEWLDPQPVAIGLVRPQAFATDGTDILAASATLCFQGISCLTVQRLSMNGPLSGTAAVTVPRENYVQGDPALASNGRDYLLVWSDSLQPICPFECAIPPFRVLALRLRADGAPIDAHPIVLEDSSADAYGRMPTAAWNGGRYVVAWSNGLEIRGATVTTDGTVRDSDPAKGATVLRRSSTDQFLTPKLVAFDSGFALFAELNSFVSADRATWEGVVFCATCDLHSVVALPATAILEAPYRTGYGSFDVAARGDSLVVTYDRVGDAVAGWVPRVFARTLAPVLRRRAVTR